MTNERHFSCYVMFFVMVQLCFACKAPNSSFVFPNNRGKVFKWMNILGFEDVPGKMQSFATVIFPPRTYSLMERLPLLVVLSL